MYHLSFAPAARRQWEKLITRIPLSDCEALETAIDGLTENPRPSAALKLAGEKDAYRLRVNDYRIIHKVDDAGQLILVAKVARRTESTYQRR